MTTATIMQQCQGQNCTTRDGSDHSPECIVEAAKVQGWADSPEAIEAKIQAKGLTAPRVTPVDIEANIASEHYFTAAEGVHGAFDVKNRTFGSEISSGDDLMDAANPPAHLHLVTICLLILHNGTKIVGINYGAIDPNQHSEQRGREEARAHAIEQIWPLMGYALRERLHATQPNQPCTGHDHDGCGCSNCIITKE